jgi:hypothetical protein
MDLFSRVVSKLAEVAGEMLDMMADVDGQRLLAQRSGRRPPSPPLPAPAADTELSPLFAKVQSDLVAQASSLDLLQDFGSAMYALVTFVQQAGALHSREDAANLVADWFALVSVDHLRRTNPASVAALSALHLLSDDRLRIVDLVKAFPHWGNFLLGSPADDDSCADDAALIAGTLLAVAGAFIPQEDKEGSTWRQSLLFGWDVPDPSPSRAQRALQRMATVRLTHVGTDDDQHLGLTTLVVPPSSGGWGVLFAIDFGERVTFPIGKDFELSLDADAYHPMQAFFGDKAFVEGSASGLGAQIFVRRKAQAAGPWTFGPENALHLEIGSPAAGLELGDPMRAVFQARDGALVLPRDALGFLGGLLPDAGLRVGFDFDLQLDNHWRVSFAGGAGMQATVALNRTLSGLRLKAVTLTLGVVQRAAAPTAGLGATVAFELDIAGVMRLSVDGLGALLGWTPGSPDPEKPANLGPAGQLGVDLITPRGVGIDLHPAGLHGGGYLFLDPDRNNYAGVLDISLPLAGQSVHAKAFGLLRDRRPAWDLVAVVSTQFAPGLPLFAGITLTGVGVIVGINASVDGDRLRAAVRDGSLGLIMFPPDPLASAPQIIETLGNVFPHSAGGCVLGILLQASFAQSVATLAIGIATVTRPLAQVLFGKLRIAAPPTGDALIQIEADFAGAIDFQTSAFSFDASLVHSRIGTFPVSGDMAMRAGGDGYLLAAGGFHPHFTPTVQVPKQRRLALDISQGRAVKIRAEAYVAVTSNTFQFGGKLTLDIDAGAASVHGALAFDTLLKRQPQWFFSVAIAARLELRVGSRSVAGVSVDLLLEGPGPWHAKGHASLHFLFFTIHVRFDKTWGKSAGRLQAEPVDAVQEVVMALGEDSAWVPIAPARDELFTLRPGDSMHLRLHPLGTLQVRQGVAPFGVSIARIGARPVIGGAVKLAIEPAPTEPGLAVPALGPSTGHFAKSEFIDMSEQDRLAQPSFEPYQDGIVFGAGAPTASSAVRCSAEAETVFVPELERQERVELPPALLDDTLEYGQVARAGLHAPELNDGPDQRVNVAPRHWRVASGATLRAVDESVFDSFTAAQEVADALTTVPDALVVGTHELMF